MEKKLRIAIVCDAIDTIIGGSVISAQRFAAGLLERGHSIIWITSKFENKNKKKDFTGTTIYEFPRLFPLGPQKTRFAYTSVARLTKIFDHEQIDIIYSIHPTIIGWQSIRAGKKLHIPIVSHSHVWPELTLPGAPRCIQKIIKKIIAGMYRKCDGLISPTQLTQRIFDDCNLKNKQVIISNGVDTDIFCTDRQGAKDIFTVLFVGRLDTEKNLPLLLHAIHLLHIQKNDSNIRYIMVGGGSEKQKLDTLVASYGLGDIVEFTGKLPAASARLVELYQTSSVFVLPSIYELEGMVVLEAMACGCPLLIANSPTSAAKDFVHNNGYVFDPIDPQDLADKIYALSNNPELCERMGKVSSDQAQNFSFTLSVQKLESFLSSFVYNK